MAKSTFDYNGILERMKARGERGSGSPRELADQAISNGIDNGTIIHPDDRGNGKEPVRKFTLNVDRPVINS